MRYAAREAIPPGGGGFADDIRFIMDAEYRKQVMALAEQAVTAYIGLIKNAPDNTYGNDDETIAAVVLARLAEKEGKK